MKQVDEQTQQDEREKRLAPRKQDELQKLNERIIGPRPLAA